MLDVISNYLKMLVWVVSRSVYLSLTMCTFSPKWEVRLQWSKAYFTPGTVNPSGIKSGKAVQRIVWCHSE